MKKTVTLTLALLSAIMIPAIQQVHAASQPFDGDFSDSMCGKKHTMAVGKTDAKCVQECIKSGSSYALVAGTKVYTLAAKPETIAPFLQARTFTSKATSKAQSSQSPRLARCRRT